VVQTFACPSCGATLEYSGGGRTVQCPYCATVAQAPEALWRPSADAQAARQWKNWILLFLALTVGLPTCLGVLGTALGIGGGILAAILPFVLRMLGR